MSELCIYFFPEDATIVEIVLGEESMRNIYIYIYPGVTSGITGTLTIVKLLYIEPDNAHMQCASLLKHVKD